MNLDNTRLIPNTSCLPPSIEAMVRRALLDRFTGTVQLNIKDGVILGFHRNEIVSLPANEIRR